MENIGLKIYNWRMENNLNLTEAARTLDISNQSIANYERGLSTPSPRIMQKITQIIHLAPDEEPTLTARERLNAKLDAMKQESPDATPHDVVEAIKQDQTDNRRKAEPEQTERIANPDRTKALLLFTAGYLTAIDDDKAQKLANLLMNETGVKL